MTTWIDSLPVSRKDIERHQRRYGSVAPNSEYWYECRRGRVTASRRGMMLQDPNDWANLALDLEKDVGPAYARTEINPFAAGWGHKYEPVALKEIGDLFGEAVVEPGFILHDMHCEVGCTPDGYLGTDITIQVKCLNMQEHMLTISSGTIQRKYYSQVQFESWVSRRQRIIYASFHPNISKNDKNRLHLIDVPVDNALQDLFETNVNEFRRRFNGEAPFPAKVRPARSSTGGININQLF